ncbi:glycosyltransferase involved in cell wall biosynthesis/SAM-dependent methyltransferase [Friedmanniella endophytica]|uniref:Glycosyltransferase involved in cell wall biosynthesis/SAM-dependent methyltransferase n=1 Tax=Microlunatus kandeliicorticis TaxID=1759536 RepID=A0A7W3IS53_9ACTN|nr:glycosyltransferase involved in cell wall biosynthesis/SAM-dependent methyltransferase [Microlunatus kandeliicorticis]
MAEAVDRPRVSVVMIFRDPPANFFAEAIDSVLVQSLPAVELLLCDDGSGARATDLARARAAAAPDRVRYLEHPGHAHLGMSHSRNLGIAAASADLVAFLDADDRWAPDHLAGEVALLDAHPEADLVVGRALDWRSWGDPDASDAWSPLPAAPGALVAPPHLLAAVLRDGAVSTPTCSLLVRRETLRAVGGGVARFTGMYEDQVLLARLYLRRTAVVSGAKTAFYRRHGASSSARAVADRSYHPVDPNPSREAYLRWLAEDGLTAPDLVAGSGPDSGTLRALRTEVARQLVEHERAARPTARARRRAGQVVRTLRSATPEPVKAPVRRVRVGVERQILRATCSRRLEPASRQFGYDRGQPIDRWYIERFLGEHAHLVSGDVLEVGDDAYTRAFGADRVRSSAVLNIDPTIPGTTVVADLADAPQLASASFDCLIVTQTLHLIWDLEAAARTLHRLLRPGGTLLLTVPGISQVATDRWAETWYWSLTPTAARRLFEPVFDDGEVEVRSWGNVLSSTAFLTGLAVHELSADALDPTDPQYPLVVGVRATRAMS